MQHSIKIKEEPKGDGYEVDDDGFEDIGTFEEAAIIEDNSGKYLVKLWFSNQLLGFHSHTQYQLTGDGYLPMIVTSAQSIESTLSRQSQPSMITTLDGNIQLEAVQRKIGTNKIKINIAKYVTNNVINVI